MFSFIRLASVQLVPIRRSRPISIVVGGSLCRSGANGTCGPRLLRALSALSLWRICAMGPRCPFRLYAACRVRPGPAPSVSWLIRPVSFACSAPPIAPSPPRNHSSPHVCHYAAQGIPGAPTAACQIMGWLRLCCVLHADSHESGLKQGRMSARAPDTGTPPLCPATQPTPDHHPR